jgi:hypothetical protein
VEELEVLELLAEVDAEAEEEALEGEMAAPLVRW